MKAFTLSDFMQYFFRYVHREWLHVIPLIIAALTVLIVLVLFNVDTRKNILHQNEDYWGSKINNKQPPAPIQNQILTTNLPPEDDPEALPPEEHLCHPHFYTEHK